MITTFTGANSLTLQRALRARIDTFVAEQGDLALERLDGQEVSPDRIDEALTSLPFLATKKLVVLRSPGTNKPFLEKFEQLLGNIAETTDVIIVEPKLDKRLAYYKWLKKYSEFQEFTEMDAGGLARWIVDQAAAQGGTISASDARYLIERVGVNQQLVSTDLDKLLLYNKHVTRTTIDVLTDATPQSTIFELLEAAFAGHSQRALALYKEQRALKVEPQQILAMLSWQLHVLAICKAAGERSAETIASDAKMSPFVVRKSLATARKIPVAQLRKLVSDLLQIDVKSKRTAIDLDEALQHFLLTLC